MIFWKFWERVSLWGALYGVTLAILLYEHVALERALAWGAVASTAKFLVVSLHHRIWFALNNETRPVQPCDPPSLNWRSER